MKYRVAGTTEVYWDVIVEAENEEEAMDIADDTAFWDIEYLSAGETNIGDTEIVSTEILEEIDED